MHRDVQGRSIRPYRVVTIETFPGQSYSKRVVETALTSGQIKRYGDSVWCGYIEGSPDITEWEAESYGALHIGSFDCRRDEQGDWAARRLQPMELVGGKWYYEVVQPYLD